MVRELLKDMLEGLVRDIIVDVQDLTAAYSFIEGKDALSQNADIVTRFNNLIILFPSKSTTDLVHVGVLPNEYRNW